MRAGAYSYTNSYHPLIYRLHAIHSFYILSLSFILSIIHSSSLKFSFSLILSLVLSQSILFRFCNMCQSNAFFLPHPRFLGALSLSLDSRACTHTLYNPIYDVTCTREQLECWLLVEKSSFGRLTTVKFCRKLTHSLSL